MIEALGITVRYPRVLAVDGVDLRAAEGEVVGVIGPNGAGKTTLLECVEGLRKPDAGKISVNGVDPLHDRAAMAAQAGVQPQHAAFPPRSTVDDVARMFASFYAKPADYRELLAQFGLGERLKQQVVKLSGGEQQRLSLVLALLGRPKVVFLDELTTGLDPVARRMIWEELRKRNNDGLTVVLTSHYMDEVEYLCDRVTVLVKGKAVAVGSPGELVREHADAGEKLVVERAELGDRLSDMEGVRLTPSGNRVFVSFADNGARERAEHLLSTHEVSWRSLSASLEDVYLNLTGVQAHEH